MQHRLLLLALNLYVPKHACASPVHRGPLQLLGKLHRLWKPSKCVSKRLVPSNDCLLGRRPSPFAHGVPLVTIATHRRQTRRRHCELVGARGCGGCDQPCGEWLVHGWQLAGGVRPLQGKLWANVPCPQWTRRCRCQHPPGLSGLPLARQLAEPATQWWLCLVVRPPEQQPPVRNSRGRARQCGCR